MKYIDSWFWCRYTMNPYRGCHVACTYCDARSQHYYLHQDFKSTIYVKHNAPDLLENKLKSFPTIRKDVIALAGVCDAYQPAEEKHFVTQNLLQKILKYQYPVNISTKMKLILRDIDLFNQIANKTWVSLAFTIISTNQEILNFLEPNASLVKDRLDAIKFISSKYPRIQIGVNYLPVIPFLEDSEEDLEQVIKSAKEAGANYIHCAPGMTLRDTQKTFFLTKLKKFYQQHNQIETYYEFIKLIENPSKYSSYLYRINKLLQEYCKKYDISMRSQRWIPSDFRHDNYLAAEKLLNLAYFNQINNKPYKEYLWAGLIFQNLPDSIGNLLARNKLHDYIIMNPEIKKQIYPYLSKKTNLDYFLNSN